MTRCKINQIEWKAQWISEWACSRFAFRMFIVAAERLLPNFFHILSLAWFRAGFWLLYIYAKSFQIYSMKCTPIVCMYACILSISSLLMFASASKIHRQEKNVHCYGKRSSIRYTCAPYYRHQEYFSVRVIPALHSHHPNQRPTVAFIQIHIDTATMTIESCTNWVGVCVSVCMSVCVVLLESCVSTAMSANSCECVVILNFQVCNFYCAFRTSRLNTKTKQEKST